MMILRSYIFFISILCFRISSGQEIPAEVLEKVAENPDLTTENAILTDLLTDKLLQPVDLNNASMQEIESIPFLSKDQSFKLQEYLLNWGEVFSIYELQVIPGFDSTLLQRIGPFILIRPVSNEPELTPRNFLRFANHTLMVRYSRKIPRPDGYILTDSTSSTFYPGTPDALFFRFSSGFFDKVSIGIAGEKDPGEQLFAGSQRMGLDHYAGYISIRFNGIPEKLILGNFRAGFGQGLCMGSGTSLSMIPGTGFENVSESGIRPSLGMSQTRYLSGVAASAKIKPFRFYTFLSYHPRDATLKIVNNEEVFSSFSESGYHRTNTELLKRNTVQEILAGGHIQVRHSPSQQVGLQIGITGFITQYSVQKTAGEDLYQKFHFHGRWNQISGLDVLLRFRNGNFYTEISRSRNGGWAWLAGINITPDPRLQIHWRLRHFGLRYQNEHTATSRQFSNGNSETGSYFSMVVLTGRTTSLTLFFDIFKSQWSQYRNDLPGAGEEFGAHFKWQPTRSTTMIFRFLEKKILTNRTGPGISVLHDIANVTGRTFNISVEWLPTEKLRLKSRIDIKSSIQPEQGSSYGFSAIQDIMVTFSGLISTFTVRYGFFDIPSYETRIYLYEPQVLYGYSVPVFEGKGNRIIAMIRFKYFKPVVCWFRCGITTYFDRISSGSGPDRINSAWSGELTGQIQIKF